MKSEATKSDYIFIGVVLGLLKIPMIPIHEIGHLFFAHLVGGTAQWVSFNHVTYQGPQGGAAALVGWGGIIFETLFLFIPALIFMFKRKEVHWFFFAWWVAEMFNVIPSSDIRTMAGAIGIKAFVFQLFHMTLVGWTMVGYLKFAKCYAAYYSKPYTSRMAANRTVSAKRA